MVLSKSNSLRKGTTVIVRDVWLGSQAGGVKTDRLATVLEVDKVKGVHVEHTPTGTPQLVLSTIREWVSFDRIAQ